MPLKKIILLSSLSLIQSSFGQEVSPAQADNQSYLQQFGKILKEQVSLGYYGEFLANRNDENEIDSLNMVHVLNATIKPATNWRIKASGEFKMNTRGESSGDYPNRYYRALYSIIRDNVLKESEHGIGLNLGVAKRQFAQQVNKNSYGNWRLTAEITKSLSPRANFNLFALYLFNDYKKAAIGNRTTYKQGFNLIPTFTYQMTDKISYMFFDDSIVYYAKYRGQGQNTYWIHDMTFAYFTYQINDINSTSLQFKYIHATGGKNPYSKELRARTDSFFTYLSHSYQITPKISVSPEVGVNLFKSKDGRDGFAENIKYPEFAFYVYARL